MITRENFRRSSVISKWHQSKNVREISSSLGLARYYIKFEQGFSNSYLQERIVSWMK